MNTKTWIGIYTQIPVKYAFFIGMTFKSYNGAIAASRVPNSESIPNRINMKKNKIAQSGDTSISKKASQNVMNASPGPEPTLRKINDKKIDYHSFSGPNVCLARLQINFAGPQIYLQPAKIRSQHFRVLLNFLVCNWKYCIWRLCVKIFHFKCVFIGQPVSEISKFLTAYKQLKP